MTKEKYLTYSFLLLGCFVLCAPPYWGIISAISITAVSAHLNFKRFKHTRYGKGGLVFNTASIAIFCFYMQYMSILISIGNVPNWLEDASALGSLIVVLVLGLSYHQAAKEGPPEK